jgi:hypothetical protein
VFNTLSGNEDLGEFRLNSGGVDLRRIAEHTVKKSHSVILVRGKEMVRRRYGLRGSASMHPCWRGSGEAQPRYSHGSTSRYRKEVC